MHRNLSRAVSFPYCDLCFMLWPYHKTQTSNLQPCQANCNSVVVPFHLAHPLSAPHMLMSINFFKCHCGQTKLSHFINISNIDSVHYTKCHHMSLISLCLAWIGKVWFEYSPILKPVMFRRVLASWNQARMMMIMMIGTLNTYDFQSYLRY